MTEAMEHIDYGLQRMRDAHVAQGARIDALEARGPAGGAPSGDTTALREEVSSLRAEVEELQTRTDEVEESASEVSDSILDELASRLTFSGYSAAWLEARQNQNSFFRGFRVNLLGNAQINDHFRFFLEFELEDAKAVGEGQGALEAEQGYVELKLHEAVGVRSGIQLVPFGYFNRYHEDWRYDFTDRPLMSAVVIPSTFVDVGFTLFGTPISSEGVQLAYVIGVFNGLTADFMTKAAGGSGLRDARPVFNADNNAAKSLSGRVSLSFGEPLELGASAYWGPYQDNGSDAILMLDGDVTVTLKHLSFRAEGVFVRIDPGTRPFDDDGDPATPDVQDPYPTTMAGVMAEAEVHGWPAFLDGTILGDFDEPQVFVAGRLDLVTQNFASGHSPQETVLSASVGYRPVHRSNIRLELEKGFAGNNGGIDLNDDWEVHVAFAVGY